MNILTKAFTEHNYQKSFLFFVATVTMAVSVTSPLQAIDTFYKENNILFSGDEPATSCSAIVTFNGNFPAVTLEKLASDGVKEKAEANMERYAYAESQTGVPWQVAAAIHYREATMDPNKSMADGSPLSAGVSADGLPISSDPNKDAANMIDHFLTMANSVYGLDRGAVSSWNAQSWGQAFLAYNRGNMYKSVNLTYETSPYVLNYIDDAHLNMPWQKGDSYYGDTRYNGLFENGQKDSQLGAMVIATFLGMKFDGTTGSTGGSTNCSGPGAVAGDIASTAINFSWPNGDHAYDDPKPEYAAAMKEVGLEGTGCSSNGADCAVFVATVMRASGADPEFPTGTDTVLAYLRTNANYAKVEATTTAGLIPGDIFIISGHTFLYVGDGAADGGKNMAAASCDEKTGNREYDVYFSDRRGVYEIYRKK